MRRLLEIVAVVAMSITFFACRTVKVVEVPVERIKMQREVGEKRDSIYVRDSVLHVIAGDTVIIERWHVKYKEVLRVDTLQSTDTVTNVVRVDVPVEVNVLYWWQKALMFLGVLGLIVVVLKLNRLWN